MGRRRLAVGEHGTITVTTVGPKHYRGRCRVRCRDGVIRQVQADGASKQKATDATVARARDVSEAAGRAMPGAAVAVLTPATSVAVLATKWMEQKEQSGDVAPQTLPDYRRISKIITEAIGELEIRQVTPGTLEWLIEAEAADLPSKAAGLRRQLTGMFTLAIRHEAYEGANPARELTVVRSKRADTRALDVAELTAYRERVRLWMTSSTPEDVKKAAEYAASGRRMGGKPRASDLLDIVDLQVATGARISEVLALRWQDVDLDAAAPSAHICGTLVRLPGGRSAGGGLIRQEHRKAKDRFTVILPGFAVATLLRLKVSARPNPHDVIFTSGTGTLRSPENLRTQLRKARGEEFAWVKPHTFRKTVATLVANEASLEDAARQLGHSGTAVTAKHYVQRSTVAPDLTAVLDKLAPGSN